MNKTAKLLAALLITIQLNAQDFGWAIKQSGSDAESVYQIAEDGMGNIYELGNFWTTVDFDPGAAVYNLTSAGLTDNFLCKLDASGNFVWAKKFGSANYDFSDNLLTTPSGILYVGGRFQITVDFDPGAGVYNLTSSGGDDAYISSYNSNGDFIWAIKFGGTGADWMEGLVERNGYLYATGYFQGTVDFDPGIGVYNLTATGPDAAFIVKLDAGGNFVWARSISGTSSVTSYDLAVDDQGMIYIGGQFWGTCDFDPGTGVVNKSAAGFESDAFLLALNEAGNYSWVSVITGYSNQWIRVIEMNTEGKIVTTGSFEGTPDFDPGAGSFTIASKGSYDIFVATYSANYGDLSMAESVGGTLNDQVYDLAIAEKGDHYLTGSFGGTVDFDPGAGIFSINALGISDIFLLVLNAEASFKNAYGFGAAFGSCAGFSVMADVAGRITMAGGFQKTIDFDPGSEVYNLTSINTTTDCFVVQFNSCTPITTNLSNNICAGDSLFVAGDFQTASGEYIDYFISASGCDSIVTLTLSVIPLSNTIIEAGICSGESYTFNGIIIYQQGIYTANYTDSNGCDSIVMLDLKVTEINASVTLQNDTLIAGGNGTVQWIYCESGLPVPGEVNNIFIPDKSGSYAAIITNGNCSDTTDCTGVFTMLQNENNFSGVSIFPNPATDLVTISLEKYDFQAMLILRNVLGEFVTEKEFSSETAAIDLSGLRPGVYFIQIVKPGKTLIEKILLQ